MTPQMIFGISVPMSGVVWALISARFFWPALREMPRAEALRPVLLLFEQGIRRRFSLDKTQRETAHAPRADSEM